MLADIGTVRTRSGKPVIGIDNDIADVLSPFDIAEHPLEFPAFIALGRFIGSPEIFQYFQFLSNCIFLAIFELGRQAGIVVKLLFTGNTGVDHGRIVLPYCPSLFFFRELIEYL
ncbi:hypothetical protein DN53_15560 [Flagellimonas olearia]|uniref:Uncharacterized protein n=1 Tax=Flagellimonas olearia TaxID=552546 RepID=A0A444VK07_9FLAO|nr:hypothetical protein DN53_15560 [Allomuricauda olearia]